MFDHIILDSMFTPMHQSHANLQLYMFVNFLFLYFAIYSTVSSAVNSLAAVCIEDMVKPALRLFKNSEPTDATYTWITKGIGWCSHELKCF